MREANTSGWYRHRQSRNRWALVAVAHRPIDAEVVRIRIIGVKYVIDSRDVRAGDVSVLRIAWRLRERHCRAHNNRPANPRKGGTNSGCLLDLCEHSHRESLSSLSYSLPSARHHCCGKGLLARCWRRTSPRNRSTTTHPDIPLPIDSAANIELFLKAPTRHRSLGQQIGSHCRVIFCVGCREP